MVDPITARRWLYRALFLALATLLLLVQLMPFTSVAGLWPGPDLILAVALAWGFRRPDYVPALAAAAAFLMADMLLQRPPGLQAALVVLALELMRNRNPLWRDLPFQTEWAIVATIMAGLALGNWAVLAALAVSQPTIGLYVIQFLATAAAYPFVVAASALLFGVRRIAPGEMDALA
jgi:rod shape-determining protein MreD